MPNYSREDILKLVKEHNIHFIRLQFTDILGTLKNVAISASQLEKALDNQIMFDGSSIEGFVRIQESDQNLRPDLSSFAILPWRPTQGGVARMICDVYTPEGKPFAGCPRYVLKRALKEAADMGYTINIGPELEFFLLNLDEKGNPTLATQDRAGYFDLGPFDHGEDARRDMVMCLERMGFEVEASHHEVAIGQHEIDFKYDDALITADNIMTFKMVVRAVAKSHNLHATFMPKPITGIHGSGMHTNMSLVQDGKNAFADPQGPSGLSQVAYSFIAGLMEHARGFTALTNPLINSYKRLVPGYEAPCYIAWSGQNRSPLIRIPASRGAGTRVELRCPDPASNPYLQLAAVLRSGLDGIKRNLQPPAEVHANIFDMSEEERAAKGILSLPGSLQEAIECLQADPLMHETLGDHVYNNYIVAKKRECAEYNLQVHTWEHARYLTTI